MVQPATPLAGKADLTSGRREEKEPDKLNKTNKPPQSSKIKEKHIEILPLKISRPLSGRLGPGRLGARNQMKEKVAQEKSPGSLLRPHRHLCVHIGEDVRQMTMASTQTMEARDS